MLALTFVCSLSGGEALLFVLRCVALRYGRISALSLLLPKGRLDLSRIGMYGDLYGCVVEWDGWMLVRGLLDI